MTYRCFFIGDDGRIKAAEIVEDATDDIAALKAAKCALAVRGYLVAEVWERKRRVGILRGDEMEMPPREAISAE